jgi:ribonuclease P protein component
MVVTKGAPRIAVVAPTKGFKTAVLRNRTRRRMSEATKQFLAKIKMPVQIIIIAKPAIIKSASTQISADLSGLFVKAGIMR